MRIAGMRRYFVGDSLYVRTKTTVNAELLLQRELRNRIAAICWKPQASERRQASAAQLLHSWTISKEHTLVGSPGIHWKGFPQNGSERARTGAPRAIWPRSQYLQLRKSRKTLPGQHFRQQQFCSRPGHTHPAI